MDNLSVHKKSRRVGELIESAGAKGLYLPPYSSPEYNPIEEAFSKIKNLLSGRAEQAFRAVLLVDAIGAALSEISGQDRRAFLEHCGYHELIQPL